MTLQELATKLGLEFKGPEDYEIAGVRDIEILPADQAPEENRIYFVETPAVLKRHPEAPARGAVLTTAAMAASFPRALIAPDGKARRAFIALLSAYDDIPVHPAGISPKALVDPAAKIAASAAILPGAVVMAHAKIGERCVVHPGAVIHPYASIGDDTVLHSAVVIEHHCVVGRNCIIHAGTVIGSDGFGFYDDAEGRHKVPQIGTVTVGDHVEMGSGCTIDRATIASTTIGAHTKLDNQVHVAHNCRIGRFVYIAGNSGLAGSVVLEDGVMISGMVSVKDHVTLAKGTIIMGMSGVAQDTEPKTAYFGTPARPARTMHKMNAALERLPELLAKLRKLDETPAS